MLNEINNKSLPLPPKKDAKWKFGSQRNKKCEKHKYVDKHGKISYLKKKKQTINTTK